MFFAAVTQNKSLDIIDTDDFVIERYTFDKIPELLKAGLSIQNLPQLYYAPRRKYYFHSRLFRSGHIRLSEPGDSATTMAVDSTQFNKYLLSKGTFDFGDMLISYKADKDHLRITPSKLSIWYQDYALEFEKTSLNDLILNIPNQDPVKLTGVFRDSKLNLVGKYKNYLLVSYVDLTKAFYLNLKTGILTLGLRNVQKSYEIPKMSKTAYMRSKMFE